MKTVLVLSILLCAALAAPAEDQAKAPEAAVEAPKEQVEAAAPALKNSCPNGWKTHGSRCFKFISTRMTWLNAERHCRNLGAHLASVINPREYSFLQQITPVGQSVAWLGGTNVQGDWMWTDGEGFYYKNWSYQYSSSSYPCIYLLTTTGWRNTVCGSSLPFICSKNPFGC